MTNKELLVYRDSDELRSFIKKEKRQVIRFEYLETHGKFPSKKNSIIDITSMVYRVNAFAGDVMVAGINLDSLDDKVTIIARDNCADNAIELFPYHFSNKRYIYEKDKEEEQIFNMAPEKTVFTYANSSDLFALRDYCKKKGIQLLSLPAANDILPTIFEQVNGAMELLIDLSSMAYAIESNKSILYWSEQFFTKYKNANYMVITKKADTILEYYPLYFSQQKHIEDLYAGLELTKEESQTTSVIRVVDDEVDLEYVNNYVDNNLFGHSNFKSELKHGLRNYVTLYKANELPIYSIFLFGKSGIGKTEVARLLCNALKSDSYLAKINFQNYSSQDALNSLIGSPAGYIGCEHGELSEKVAKSKVGVLLCDEFEKTTRPVFSFFLQMLEEGKFTDSLAREYDLKGYIVVFTSNIQTVDEYKAVIPPELQTRFDLVCEFDEPSKQDKEAYLEYLLKTSKLKGIEQLDHIAHMRLTKLAEYKSSSMRELKKEFDTKLLELIEDTNNNED